VSGLPDDRHGDVALLAVRLDDRPVPVPSIVDG
jgi:hypothetical protein